MKWNSSLVQISTNGTVGVCPYCGSEDTDFLFVDKKSGRGYLDVWCNSCKEQVHVDCGHDPRNHKHKQVDKAIAV